MYSRLVTVMVILALALAACDAAGSPLPPSRTPRPTITATVVATDTTAGASTAAAPLTDTPSFTGTPDASVTESNPLDTPGLTETLQPSGTPTRRPVIFRTVVPLQITNILLIGVTRDPNRDNGAVAMLQIVYVGGRTPYKIYHDEVLQPDNPFPVPTVCSGTLIHTIRLTSGDRQVVTKQYYLAPITCPP